jgi:hypothetical protein
MGEAIPILQLAEQITPKQTRTHRVARDVTCDLLQLSGLRPRPELRELAERLRRPCGPSHAIGSAEP